MGASRRYSVLWPFWITRALLISSVVLSNFATIVSSFDNTTTTSPSTEAPNITIFSCKWDDLKFPVTYGPAIACALAIVVGGFELLFGFKYLRSTLFLTGFTGGATLTYFICMERSNLLFQYILLITGAVAVFIGILCTTVVFCGLFSSGLAAGFSIGMAFLLGFSTLYSGYDIISIPLGVIITVAVVIAGISVWWKRCLIVTSSIYGGALIMAGADYFIEDLWLLRYSLKKIFIVPVYGELCIVSWVILSSWPLLTFIGLLVQFLKTGKKPQKPKKDLYDKHYIMGSPYYSAPDLDAEDIEMEVLIPQTTTSNTTQATTQAHLNTEETI